MVRFCAEVRAARRLPSRKNFEKRIIMKDKYSANTERMRIGDLHLEERSAFVFEHSVALAGLCIFAIK